MSIEFYRTASDRQPVREYLSNLPKHEIVRITKALEEIQARGFNAVGVRFRQIQGKLWEIKISEHRIFYVVIESDLMVLLHAYRKQSQKLPYKDRWLAIERMKRVLW